MIRYNHLESHQDSFQRKAIWWRLKRHARWNNDVSPMCKSLMDYLGVREKWLKRFITYFCIWYEDRSSFYLSDVWDCYYPISIQTLIFFRMSQHPSLFNELMECQHILVYSLRGTFSCDSYHLQWPTRGWGAALRTTVVSQHLRLVGFTRFGNS